MTQTPADREPSALPLGGYWLGMLFAGLPALFASRIVYSATLPSGPDVGLADSILTAVMLCVPLIAVVVYYRSARRWGYSASLALAALVVLLIWAGTAVALVMNSFGEMSLKNLDPEPVAVARDLSESLLRASACLLTVNIACALALNAEDWPGRAVRFVFTASASLWGVLIALPVLVAMLTGR